MSKEKKKELINEENQEILEENNKKIIKTERGETFTEEEWVTPIFDGGPTRQEVEEWKDKYGSIYYTPFENGHFIWRTLTRQEYRQVVTDDTLTLHDREEKFTDMCVLFPRNFESSKMDKGNAGVASVLAEMIMEKSGFVAQTGPIKL